MKPLKTIAPPLLVTVTLLIAIELIARYTLSKIYNRTFDKSLIEAHKYDLTDGLKANATGIVWGKVFHTDDMGGRLQSKPKNGKHKLLLIGDSVTEGVGVDDSSTFAYKVAHEIEHTDLRNISFIGWSSADYNHVLTTLLKSDNDSSITEVWLFYCLNDIYSSTKTNDLPQMGNRGILSTINILLQRRYATYKLLKLWLYQQSDYYYRYDARLYTDTTKVNQTVHDLSLIASICNQHGARLKVVMLPYRSQLKNPKANYPQQVLSQRMSVHHIPYLDLLPSLATTTQPDALYLYADEIHLSMQGHNVVAQALINSKSQ